MNLEFPPLFVNADTAAARLQVSHFRLLRGQYLMLLTASLVTVLGRFIGLEIAAIIYLLCVFLAIIALVRSVSSRPEKGWYNARAVAESVKTTTWRFVMGAEPFELDQTDDEAKLALSERLEAIKSAHDPSDAAIRFGLGVTHGDIVTQSMAEMRALPFSARKDIYINDRITDQLSWYQKKSAFNDQRAKILSYVCIGLYGAAILFGLLQVYYSNDEGHWLSNIQWASEPILVAAASILGWMQAKRYAELAASYNLAADDILHVKANIEGIYTEPEFALAVTDAESAFSREHTQWVARQSQS